VPTLLQWLIGPPLNQGHLTPENRPEFFWIFLELKHGKITALSRKHSVKLEQEPVKFTRFSQSFIMPYAF
jgi:hypothetical protein